MILIDLSKKDKLWRSIAFNICKDKSLADELTQQMYLKVYETSLKRDIETNDYYIARVLINLFLDYIKENKKLVTFEDIFSLESNDEVFELDTDTISKKKNVLNNLKFLEKELFRLYFVEGLSYHEIQRKYNINYQFSRRVILKIQNKYGKR